MEASDFAKSALGLRTPPIDIAPLLPLTPLSDGSAICQNGIRLIAREQSILRCVNADFSSKQTAKRLGVSRSAVENCLDRLRQKLGLTRGRLIVFWEYATTMDDGTSTM